MTHEEDAIVFNIRHYFDADGILGEDVVQSVLSDFSCSKNKDVERFLKEQAVDFTKTTASNDLQQRTWKETTESSIL